MDAAQLAQIHKLVGARRREVIAKTNRPPESITLHPRMRYAICRDQVVYEVKHTGAETWFDIPVTEDATLPPWRVLITNGRETYQVDIDPTWLPD